MSDETVDEVQTLSVREQAKICARILGLAWQIRPVALVGYAAGALLEIASLLVSLFASAKLAALLALFLARGQTTSIWFWLWVDVASVAITGLSFLLMSYHKRMLYFAFVRWDINQFLGAVCRFDLADFYDNRTRNLLNKIGGAYIWQLPMLVEACLDLVYGIVRFLAITAIVAQIAWWIVPIIALFLIPTFIGERRLAKMQWFVWDSKGDFRHVFWGLEYMVKTAKGQMELRSTQATNFVLHKIDAMNREFYHEQQGKYRSASRTLVPTKVLEVIGTAIGSVVLLRGVLHHAISLERYFFLSGALLRIGAALNVIFGTLSRMQEGLLFADSYFELIDKTPAIVDPPEAARLPQTNAPTIRFENVSFAYPGQKPVFKKLNLEITSGEHVALVGENGAGKSTLIKLLLRFYRPTSGRILIDGQDIQEISIASWYKQLATLFQDFNQYPLTIAENIEIGRSDQAADQTRLREAADFANLHDQVKHYEHGWDTVLDSSFKKGVEPSGGQWQRVALARAFYRGANMIILDEPTSAIDAKAEYEIFNNIFRHYNDKTALIVSHRFSTVRRANRIVVLEHGKIIEQGSHRELMKREGLYHELFTKQAEGYRD